VCVRGTESRHVVAEETRTGARAGGTHLAGVDLLTAEGIVVGTHVDGVGAIPVVLVVGLSSEAWLVICVVAAFVCRAHY
jgi:hypothetical protein